MKREKEWNKDRDRHLQERERRELQEENLHASSLLKLNHQNIHLKDINYINLGGKLHRGGFSLSLHPSCIVYGISMINLIRRLVYYCKSWSIHVNFDKLMMLHVKL